LEKRDTNVNVTQIDDVTSRKLDDRNGALEWRRLL